MNRVGDEYRDQAALTGHADRETDLALLAQLPVTAFRLPMLWERSSAIGAAEWARWDRQMSTLTRLDIRPIVGLVHHGSGPPHTSLIDDGFAPGLAAHADRVARRYPQVDDWTPVNEPLTTARFSALYGIWYPHARDERLFWLALLNQIDAVRLSMRAIRRINPAARLIQTEDLGRTYATAPVRDQAAFDNQRRWMSWDLLCGRVTAGHPFWDRLTGFGLGDRLRAIADDPCPPAILGINHYLTSDRFLDHRLDRYPEALHGGSRAVRFADSEAVRVLDPPPDSLNQAIADCWARYRLPIAMTEVHNGSTRDEQLRWLEESWHTALAARASGVDLRAVTCWTLFGAQGWNTLLTGPGRYEPGAFDTSSGDARPTAIARRLATLGASHNRDIIASIADAPGWWRRPLRLAAPVQYRPAPIRDHRRIAARAQHRGGQPILIVGRHGTLARASIAACVLRAIPYVALGRAELDITDPAAIDRALERHRPWAVVNASGWVDVDGAETAADACLALNADGAGTLARECAARDIACAYFSSDLVFDGAKPDAYVESDAPNPLNVYGRSKALGEEQVLAAGGRPLVARTAAFFSADSIHSFAMQALINVGRGKRFRASDVVVSPTHVPDLAHAVLDLLIDGETGIWHLTHGEAMQWDAFARAVLSACGADAGRVDTIAADADAWRAARPRQSALASQRGQPMPSLADAIACFARDVARQAPDWRSAA
ncbi:MAG: sugar nucleotide-binding protein [Sphingomonas sp.]